MCPSNLEILSFSKAISAIYNGSWQLTTDSVTWLWTWQKRQLWRVDCQSCTGLIYQSCFLWQKMMVNFLVIMMVMSSEWYKLFYGLEELGQKTVFTCLAITLPKVNRFGWNLEHCECIVGGWPWRILGAIHAITTVWEAADMLFFCPVNNAWFHQFHVCNISRNLNRTTSIGEEVKSYGTEFWKF